MFRANFYYKILPLPLLVKMFIKNNSFMMFRKLLLITATSFVIVAWFTIVVFKQTLSYRGKVLMTLFQASEIQGRSVDLYNLRPDEQAVFFEYKEKVYAQRRERIAHYCNFMTLLNQTDFSFQYIENSIIYNNHDKIAYCQIPKVASSTWCKHFAVLSRASTQDLLWWKNAIQLFAPQAWPLPRDGRTLKQLFDDLKLSMVIVRHPFSRLASVYYEKFIYTGAKAWTNITRYIIQRFRRKSEKSVENEIYLTEETIPPTPMEFLEFVIETLLREDVWANSHWLQQFKSCPFCSVNFTVYSKMEELAEDTAYIILKGDLKGKISPDLQDNSVKGKRSERENNFWKSIPINMIKKLTNLYRPDLDMFDYSVDGYFKEIGINFR